MSKFDHLPVAAPNEIYSLTARYNADKSPQRVNLGVGAYKTDDGQPYIFNVVREAERQLLESNSNHEYLPIGGLAQFYNAARDMLFKDSFVGTKEGRIASIQTVSGTGSLRVIGEFIAKHYAPPAILVSNPTWENHIKLFTECGLGSKIIEYRYFDEKTKGVDFAGFVQDVTAAPDNSVLLLHTCAHNPTGVDLTHDQWRQILQIVKTKKMLPLFDTAYHGFVSGNFDEDGWSLRLFAEDGVELLVCQSFAKSMGLYGERCGAAHVLVSSATAAKAVQSNLETIIRPMYSSPPKHGAAIAAKILTTPALYNEWQVELKAVTERITSMRHALYDALVAKGTPGSWDHVINQKGMFTYTGLSRQQSIAMVDDHHIYMLSSGRISVAGLGTGNVKYVADCIDDVVRKYPSSL